MRRVTGPTDRVVVIGAGLGGLSSALRLVGAGRSVTVLERASIPGGRAGMIEIDGFRFDTGPTVLTLPHLIEDAFAAAGEHLSDWVELRRLDPAYQARFADGSVLDVHADVEAMSETISTEFGSAARDGYRRFVAFAKELYDLELPHFIDTNLDSPLDLVTRKTLRLLRIGGFRRLQSVVEELLPDPRLQRIFSFQAMYAGLAPHEALAIYAVISYMDCVAGVYSPVGGMHAVPVAMAAAAVKSGVEIRYDTEATRIRWSGDRAVGVETTEGDVVACDAVVINADLPIAWHTILRDRRPPSRLRRVNGLRYSPSCFLLHAGSSAHYPDQRHHTIHFGDAWKRTFTELIDDKRLMSDPSLLVTSPTVSDPGLAPAGKSTFYVLAPTPNATADIDWRTTGPAYRDEIVQRLESLGYPGFGGAIEVESVMTPADWQRAGMAAGTPFASAHTFRQTGPFRPANIAFDNVVFAGSGTQPGVGVPMVMISGRLAAERITGPVRAR